MSGYVYFISCAETGRTKIGYTSQSPHCRLKALQTGCPSALAILALQPGSQSDERDLHHRFEHICVRGEWFLPDRELADYMRAVNSASIEEAERNGTAPPVWALIQRSIDAGETDYDVSLA